MSVARRNPRGTPDTMAGMPPDETLITTDHTDQTIPAYVHTADCVDGACDGPHCPPAPPVLHPVHVEIDAFGMGTLTVDGHDLTNRVSRGGVTIQAGDGRRNFTKVFVELTAGVTYDGPAEVHIIQGAHAVEFLQSVDPTALAEATLRGGFNRNPVDVMLEVLIGMAQAIETGQEPE